ncbi:MAG: nucleotidyltransferase domain-containing protein [Chitinophagales bacterium]|nr:nucleotidyltransferase domain-containing protein [Chitinophagales bacterium]
MADKHSILATLKRVKPSLEKKYGVKDLALFGSYSRNAAVEGKSDVDVMVDFSQPIGLAFVDLADELELLLQLKVDLISRGGIKPKYFRVIEPDLIYV